MDQFSSSFKSTGDTHNEKLCNINGINDILPPEPQTGNVEYKLKIVHPSSRRFEHLVSQMKWRLREGDGQAIYEIGVGDNGVLVGLSEDDMTNTLNTLEKMAGKIEANTKVLYTRNLDNGRNIAEVLVQKVPEDKDHTEIRVAVLGNADAGKSTLLGVLTHGSLDNGRGKARLNIFRHLHEIRSGRTSSISHEFLGFDATGAALNCNLVRASGELWKRATKLISFLDLAGHKKYLKTTIRGLSCYTPHYALIVVSSATGVVDMTQEHLSFVRMLNVPFFIVVTKTDLADSRNAVDNVSSLLKQVGSRKVPLLVKNLDDALTAFSNQVFGNVVPIFSVSSVTGRGLDILNKFLFLLPPRINSSETKSLEILKPQFQVGEIIKSLDGEQLLCGLLTKGVMREGMQLEIGPFSDGVFKTTTVSSIHRNRSPVRTATAGQSAVIRIEDNFDSIRSGMVLLTVGEPAASCMMFQANITVLCHATKILPGFQATVYIANIIQPATIVEIFDCDRIQINETASVRFRFLRHPEYVTVGQKIFFRASSSKGTGEVIEVFPLTSM